MLILTHTEFKISQHNIIQIHWSLSSVVIFPTTRHCKKSLPRQGAKKGHEVGLGYKLVVTGMVPILLTSPDWFIYYDNYPSGKLSHRIIIRTFLTGHVLCRSIVCVPCGLGEDIIRPLLGSVEWYELGTFPQTDGAENSPTSRGCKVVQPHRFGCEAQLHQHGTLTHSHIHFPLTGAIWSI